MYYLHVFYLFFRFVSLCADNLVVIFEVYPLIFVPPDSAHGFVVEDAQVAELLLEVVECAEIYYLVAHSGHYLHYSFAFVIACEVYLLYLFAPEGICAEEHANVHEVFAGEGLVHVA